MFKSREAVAADFEQLMVLYRQLQPEDPVLTNGADRLWFSGRRKARLHRSSSGMNATGETIAHG